MTTMTIRSFENHSPSIDPSAFIDPLALVIGQVSIGADSSVWPMAVLRGDIHTITIGQRTSIQDGSILHVSHDSIYHPGGHSLNIADDVTVGHRVILHGCTIKSLCLIGMGSTIMDGAIIQEQVILGANSLVPPGKICESGYLWVGSPAKRVRLLTETERELLIYSAKSYVLLKDRHLNMLIKA
jgi:carbonic anhydrase/acetyltransferase-like protein (isoleucine patch superfamily)